MLLGSESGVSSVTSEQNLPISPNYIKNPPLNGKVDVYPPNGMSRRKANSNCESSSNHTNHSQNATQSTSEGRPNL